MLQVDSEATRDEIKAAYRSLAKRYHPDRYQGDKSFAEQKMKAINEAYSVLSDINQRRTYDRQCQSAAEQYTPTANQSAYQNATKKTYRNASDYQRTTSSDSGQATTVKTAYAGMSNGLVFKLITTIISLCLVFLPVIGDKELHWSDMFVWAFPVLLFGTGKGLFSDASHLIGKIGIVFLQLIMPLCGYIATYFIREYTFGNSLLFLAIVYGGGYLSYLIGRSLVN